MMEQFQSVSENCHHSASLVTLFGGTSHVLRGNFTRLAI